MNTHPSSARGAKAGIVLATLFVGMFVLGSSELMVVGVIDLMASDLAVSIPTAGSLVTAFAIGVAIGGPVLTAVTIKYDRRAVLVGAFALFIATNLVAVLTSSFGLIVAARAVTGAVHGLFIATAFATAVSVVPEERAGKAISVVISGVAVSAAFGVPLGTLLGQALGWRGSFVAVVVLAAITMAAAWSFVPPIPSAGGGGATDQARYAFAPRVLALLVLCVLVFSALFAAVTYIVPFLEAETGISGAPVSAFLLAYGVATAVGSISGGGFADRNAVRTLVLGTFGMGLSLLALYAFGSNVAAAAIILVALGFSAWSMTPSIQFRVVNLAGPGGGLAQSLPASAINVGIALGSVAGGAAIGTYSATSAVMVGFVIAAVALPVAIATGALRSPTEAMRESPGAVPEVTA